MIKGKIIQETEKAFRFSYSENGHIFKYWIAKNLVTKMIRYVTTDFTYYEVSGDCYVEEDYVGNLIKEEVEIKVVSWLYRKLFASGINSCTFNEAHEFDREGEMNDCFYEMI